MNIKLNRLVLLSLFFLLSAFSLQANPFLGSAEKDTHQAARTGAPSEGMAEKQIAVRERMADLFLAIKDGKSSQLLLLLYSLSFLYGVLHAAGPGHRKTVVFSLYLSRQAKWYEPLGFGALLALLHGGSAVLLILLYKSTAGPLLSRSVNATTLQMEGWAYTLLVLLALLLLIGSLRHAAGHSHSGKRSLMALALTGFFPCPGAIMILIFTLTQNLLTQGIISVLFMSAGMALPISLAGYLAYLGKQGLFTALKKREKLLHRASVILEVSGYSFLLIFSMIMAQPFLRSFFV